MARKKLFLRDDSQVRIRDVIQNLRVKSFVWGTRDCMLFIADIVKAMTGHDVAHSIRGTYSSEKTAKERVLARFDATDYLELTKKIFKQYRGVRQEKPNKTPLVCIVDIEGAYYGGLYFEGKALIFQPRGFLSVSKDKIVCAWGVKGE